MQKNRKILAFAAVLIVLACLFLLVRQAWIWMFDSTASAGYQQYHVTAIDTANIDLRYDMIDMRDPSMVVEEFLASVSPHRHDTFYAFVVSVDAENDTIAQAYAHTECIAHASTIECGDAAYDYDVEYAVGGSFRVFRLTDADNARNRYLLYESNVLSSDIQAILQQIGGNAES